jgi:ectoine hydroxylase-related dioxygenase (phytanoyl-CoA dioxygenase family)
MLARRLLEEVKPPFSIGDGFVTFRIEDLPFGPDALKACQEIAAVEKAAYRAAPGEKGFLRTLLSADSLRERPDILLFALSPDLAAVVTEYLGAVPTLSDVRLWWSVPSEGPPLLASSQKFHRDHEDFRQVKAFINIDPVDEDAGPFSFLPASVSERVVERLSGAHGRIEDADVFTHASEDELVVLTGPSGDGAMIDTCRCLHFGSRNESKERLVLMLHYVGFHSIVEPDAKVLDDQLRSEMQKGDPVADALLRVRPSGL